jgi:hypothetical protein
MNKWKKLFFLSLVLLLFTIPITTAFANDISADDQDRTLSPYFFIEDGDPTADKFPLKETNVIGI